MKAVLFSALVFALGVNGAQLPPIITDGSLDFCVSSRWGYSCLAKSSPFMPRSQLMAAVHRVTRTSARGALAVAAVCLVREIIRDCRTVTVDMRRLDRPPGLWLYDDRAASGASEGKPCLFLRPSFFEE
jgi:hypothetical protein